MRHCGFEPSTMDRWGAKALVRQGGVEIGVVFGGSYAHPPWRLRPDFTLTDHRLQTGFVRQNPEFLSRLGHGSRIFRGRSMIKINRAERVRQSAGLLAAARAAGECTCVIIGTTGTVWYVVVLERFTLLHRAIQSDSRLERLERSSFKTTTLN